MRGFYGPPQGRAIKQRSRRDYPHQVEIEIPELGLGTRYDAMHAFARAFAHATRGIGKLRIERGRDGMRWCFTDASHADAFHAEFAGERIRDLIS